MTSDGNVHWAFLLSGLIAWAAFVLVPGTALLGLALKRSGGGPVAARMRPHLILGFSVVGLAVVHMIATTGAMGKANPNGIWLATFALAGLAIQAFVGTNLQSPGTRRVSLRRWHVVLFWLVLCLTIGHVVLNSAL
ncbi:MAG: hypothetical protein ACLQPV_11430 [Vulcanimicrobiaceae bacterium]